MWRFISAAPTRPHSSAARPPQAARNNQLHSACQTITIQPDFGRPRLLLRPRLPLALRCEAQPVAFVYLRPCLPPLTCYIASSSSPSLHFPSANHFALRLVLLDILTGPSCTQTLLSTAAVASLCFLVLSNRYVSRVPYMTLPHPQRQSQVVHGPPKHSVSCFLSFPLFGAFTNGTCKTETDVSCFPITELPRTKTYSACAFPILASSSQSILTSVANTSGR